MQENKDQPAKTQNFNSSRKSLSKHKNYRENKSQNYPDDVGIPMDVINGDIRQYLKNDTLRQDINLKFQQFLRNFKLDGRKVYIYHLNELARTGGKSLEIDYREMASMMPNICVWLADAPRMMLELLNKSVCSLFDELYPNNSLENPEISIRITNVPVCDSIRNLRQIQLNILVCVSGVVVRISSVLPQLLIAIYTCDKCFYRTAPLFQSNSETEVRPYSCVNCQSKGPFTLNEMDSTYRNYQRLKLQELASSVVCGRMPRSKEVILLDNLVDLAYPGEEIEITGIYRNIIDKRQTLDKEFPTFDTVIEANHIQKRENKHIIQLGRYEDHHEILNLSKHPQLFKLITQSIAPFIYGHEYTKNALALALFGGQEKNKAKHRLRGDINILMLGDPGTAKSQFLKYIEKTFDRAVYTTGKGATAVGLTASVHKDPYTHEWSLQGGALVLADKGVCLIDEFDKMNDQDRVSIHEAMEQQTISISKAGIVTQLQARCTVIAAANPIHGLYDFDYSLRQNVNLSDPILSRFDLLCLLEDTIDPGIDEKLADFVVNSHVRHSLRTDDKKSGVENPKIIESHLLSKYIKYAKHQIVPRLDKSADENIARVYIELRKVSIDNAGLPISVRHLESIIRLAEAHARICLRDRVINVDVDLAIKMMVKSYISSQKFGVQKVLQQNLKNFIRYETDLFERRVFLLKKIVRNRLKNEALIGVQDDPDPENIYLKVNTVDFVDKMRENGLIDDAHFFNDPRFYDAGFSISDDHAMIYYKR
jgi:DNA replication licensing factor MCM2